MEAAARVLERVLALRVSREGGGPRAAAKTFICLKLKFWPKSKWKYWSRLYFENTSEWKPQPVCSSASWRCESVGRVVVHALRPKHSFSWLSKIEVIIFKFGNLFSKIRRNGSRIRVCWSVPCVARAFGAGGPRAAPKTSIYFENWTKSK